ncbi:MAG: hypothetical protein ACYC1C_07930 [Chloroflexota bacterium]
MIGVVRFRSLRVAGLYWLAAVLSSGYALAYFRGSGIHNLADAVVYVLLGYVVVEAAGMLACSLCYYALDGVDRKDSSSLMERVMLPAVWATVAMVSLSLIFVDLWGLPTTSFTW